MRKTLFVACLVLEGRVTYRSLERDTLREEPWREVIRRPMRRGRENADPNLREAGVRQDQRRSRVYV